MTFEVSLTALLPGDRVRFRQERLVMLAPSDRRRLEGRIGVVEGYWRFTRKLTVDFPAQDGRAQLRILSVDPRHLERLVVETESVTEPHPAPLKDAAPEDVTLSQQDLDKLFG